MTSEDSEILPNGVIRVLDKLNLQPTVLIKDGMINPDILGSKAASLIFYLGERGHQRPHQLEAVKKLIDPLVYQQFHLPQDHWSGKNNRQLDKLTPHQRERLNQRGTGICRGPGRYSQR